VSVARADSLIGSVLGGRYEVVSRVNSGGTAVVYRGSDRRLGRTVAIKVIRPDRVDEPGYVRRFDQEARSAAVLSHPNIVAIFDQGYAGDRPYIVMEYIHGQSLRSVIASSAPLPVDQALAYAESMAKALAAAHEVGIIHRDIKPENVLITTKGQLKVTDFGLAKTADSQSTAPSEGFMGTLSYMAPEMQEFSASRATDIYSTGVVLYEMLTGKKPHVAEDFAKLMRKHREVDIPAPSKALAGQSKSRIPDYVDALVVAATSRDPRVRPADGQVLEEWIAQARRALAEGKMHDAALVRQFAAKRAVDEATPIAAMAPQAAVPTSLAKAATPAVVPSGLRQPGTKLAKAPGAGKSSRRRTPSTALAGAKAPHKRRRGVVALIVVLALIVAAAGGGAVWWLASGRWTTVPDITGKNEHDAQTEVVGAALTMTTLKEYSETVPLGFVIRTTPTGATRVYRESSVTAFISLGPERYPMPTVANMVEADAKTAILSAHLSVGTVTEDFSESVAAGQVISASQNAGASLPPGTAIDLVVSKGRQPIDVQSFVGTSADEAQAGLEAAGFVVTTTKDYSSTVAQGSVISQDPSKGQLFRGDTVSLVVSLGPRMITVPDVTDQKRETACATLTDAGFVCSVAYASIFCPGGGLLCKDKAAGTEPLPGTTVAEGSTVTVYVI
jgi:serine/threonine-protein kinase